MATRSSSQAARAAGRARSRRRPIQLANLRGFAASAQHLSFTLAAAELSLTQSSISRQVQSLEEDVGVPLFVRRTRALELTPAGERLYRAVSQALAGVDRSVDEVRGLGGPPRVCLSTFASFASLWLVPRLAAFQRAHPEIEIRIDATDRHVQLETEGIDIAIRWTSRRKAPDGAVLLLEEEITPAVSPKLLERSGIALNEPADLLRLPLLEMDDALPTSAASSWARWLEFARVKGQPRGGRLYFTFVDQSMQAAIRGQGVVLARSPFLADHAAGGDLTVPFPQLTLATGNGYFLIDNPVSRELAHVAAFRQWLVQEFVRGPYRQT
jgi:DNA-binding transcriptional LysR family regulator